LLNEYIKEELKTPTSLFFVSVGIAYFIFFFLSAFNAYTWEQIMGQVESSMLAYVMMALPLAIGIFAWLFALNFVAKTLVRSERELHVYPADYFGEYIMVLFFPIGIWIIQPGKQACKFLFHVSHTTKNS